MLSATNFGDPFRGDIMSGAVQLLRAAGGVERIIAAMAAHIQSEAVQEYGCSALMNLASSSAARISMVAAIAST